MMLPAGCSGSCFAGWQLPVGVVGVYEHAFNMCSGGHRMSSEAFMLRAAKVYKSHRA